ncbi:MAG TPA: hypothetical protein VJ719_07690 [Chthoniobacterales bacterium]|nr:hypothetical protein [Chthoniobacterales bacterium]
MIQAVCRQIVAADHPVQQIDVQQLRGLSYQELPPDQWRMLNVGKSKQAIRLPYGNSYYDGVELPPVAGTIELRMQGPAFPIEGYKALLACVTFLDKDFRPTHSVHSDEAVVPPPGAFRPLESPLLEMKVFKRAGDRYMIVHTDPKLIGRKIRYALGNRGTPIIVPSQYLYSPGGRTSIDIIPTAQGKVRVKLFSKPR